MASANIDIQVESEDRAPKESIYSKIEEYALTKEKLDKLAFDFNEYYKKNKSTDETVDGRKCERCRRIYKVEIDADGNPKPLDEDAPCRYHTGKLYWIENDYEDDYYYTCCNSGNEGCTTLRYHVSEDLDYFKALDTIVSSKDSSGSNRAVYALDCEMCVTINGYECARVTVVDEEKKVVYDTLVKPPTMIIDYVTRFSGITEEMMEKGPSKSLIEVQMDLLEFIKEDTILIGHSIDNDLKVLKFHHDKNVDTSIVFPHRHPKKRNSLSWLASMKLNKVIQNGSHDSAEDARTCIELMLNKVILSSW